MAAAASPDGGDFIILDHLRGHKGQVLCASVPEPASGETVVATGAEDSTVRLWDLRAKPSSRVTKCLCRCFDGEAITSIVFRPGDSNRLFCSAGSKVLEFDLRAKDSGVLLVTSPAATIDVGTVRFLAMGYIVDGSRGSADIVKYICGKDEVNEVAVHPKGEYLAAADDSGVVKVYSVSTRRLHKTLRNEHTSICHSVRFRPRASWDVASGALDSTLVMWDFSTGRVRRKLDFVEGDFEGSWSSSTSSSSSQKVFNPPFVYSVDFSLDGRFLAAGLGDGSVAVLDAKTRDPVGRCDGHVAPISQVHYPCFAPKMLVSSGNDRRLIFWDHRPFEDEAATACAASSVSSNGHRRAGATSVSREGSLPGPGHAGRINKTMAAAHHDGNNAQVASSGGKKKGRTRKGVVRKKKGTLPQALDSDRSEDATGMPRSTSDKEPRTGSGDADERIGGKVGGMICSVALSTACLEEKPNWITSLSTPCEALVLADTSSEVKILGRRGM